MAGGARQLYAVDRALPVRPRRRTQPARAPCRLRGILRQARRLRLRHVHRRQVLMACVVMAYVVMAYVVGWRRAIEPFVLGVCRSSTVRSSAQWMISIYGLYSYGLV